MNLPDEKQLRFYDDHRVARPSHEEHGLADTHENPLSEQLPRGNPRNWRMEGNLLICDTDFGVMSQAIDPSYICHGTDDAGLPILRRVLS